MTCNNWTVETGIVIIGLSYLDVRIGLSKLDSIIGQSKLVVKMGILACLI